MAMIVATAAMATVRLELWEAKFSLAFNGNFLKLNRLESPCIAVRRFCLPDRFSPLGA